MLNICKLIFSTWFIAFVILGQTPSFLCQGWWLLARSVDRSCWKGIYTRDKFRGQPGHMAGQKGSGLCLTPGSTSFHAIGCTVSYFCICMLFFFFLSRGRMEAPLWAVGRLYCASQTQDAVHGDGILAFPYSVSLSLHCWPPWVSVSLLCGWKPDIPRNPRKKNPGKLWLLGEEKFPSCPLASTDLPGKLEQTQKHL